MSGHAGREHPPTRRAFVPFLREGLHRGSKAPPPANRAPHIFQWTFAPAPVKICSFVLISPLAINRWQYNFRSAQSNDLSSKKMTLLRSYAIWNNKGGVGKSTIAFHLASRYAEEHPHSNVLVIDLCPQANSSMMLLGGGTPGEEHVLGLCTEATPKTVVGYLSSVIAGGAGAPLPDPFSYVVQANEYNGLMPKNLHLLCGDGNLEPMAPAISAAAAAPALTPSTQPWKWVHQIFTKFIEKISIAEDEEWMVFIDTNPSFSIYTELAVSAAQRLITPVNADDSSRVATNAMFILLHGQVPPHPIYGTWTYAAQAQKHALPVPEIHVIVGNRLTQYEGAAAAFKALSDATADTLFSAYSKHPTYFTARDKKSKSVSSFRERYAVALRDFNTAGVVSAHLGRPLSQMEQGYYDVHGHKVKVNADRVSECVAALDELIVAID
jgi:cellulose biosynthesis protein BcsQ